MYDSGQMMSRFSEAVMDINTDIQYLSGVGPARAKLYKKLHVETFYELIYNFPRSYIDLSRVLSVSDCEDSQTAAVRAVIVKKQPEARIRHGLSLFKMLAADDTGELAITMFNSKYTVDNLKIGSEYLFYGVLSHMDGRAQMTAPMIFPAESGGLMPVYPLTAGISSRTIQKNVRQALDCCLGDIEEPIPEAARERYGLCPLRQALLEIHFPQTAEAAATARNRLIFEELFTLALALRQVRERKKDAVCSALPHFSPEEFYGTLPYSPTGAQRRAVAEILGDMQSGTPMNRLLQGDVGSGKTLCAAAAVLAAVKGGFQCAVMAPTEILAEQHLATFAAFLSPFGVSVVMLTGSSGAKPRREILESLASGESAVAVGTHALLERDVAFKNLGLVITDEQHRFGVAQRTALGEKSENPHVLVMSATPIPRTLALMIYGDLDVSVLDELPAGRRRINTYCISERKLARAYGFIRGELSTGRQGYIVCPLVSDEERESMGLAAAEQTAAELCEGEFSDYRVGLLHGKQKSAEKESVMREFKAGKIQLLICTTVIEVGVDVPNATIMLCQNAERFGLSQLHQLRGRVGRSQWQSYCILVSNARGETARARMKAMCETGDGFIISETDLALRGPGDFFGGRQHGLPELRLADLAEDIDVMSNAREAALAVLNNDPHLSLPEHAALRRVCERMQESVGKSPN